MLAPATRSRLQAHGPRLISVVLGPIITALGLAVGSRLLTEWAEPDAFGEYKLIMGVVSLFSGLFVRPFLQYVMRGYHDAAEQARQRSFVAYARRVLAKACGALALLVAGSLLIYGTLTGQVGLLAAAAAGVLVCLQAGISFQHSVLVTQNRLIAANLLRPAWLCGIPLATGLAALFLGQSGGSMALGELAFSLLVLAAGARVLKLSADAGPHSQSTAPDPAWNRDARAFVIPLIGVGLFSWMLSVSDRYLLAAFASPREVGLYSAAYGLGSQPLLMFTGMAAQFLYPFLFSAAAKQKEQREAQILRGMMAATSIAAVAAVVGIALFGPFLVRLLLAPEYREGALPVLLWVSCGYAALSIASTFEMKSYARKSTLRLGLGYACAAIVNLLLNLLWIPGQGMLGAAKATCFGYMAYLVALALLGRSALPTAPLAPTPLAPATASPLNPHPTDPQ